MSATLPRCAALQTFASKRGDIRASMVWISRLTPARCWGWWESQAPASLSPAFPLWGWLMRPGGCGR